ncbi:DUF29 family protein [Richelia sinica]|uniref:DUF29 family protein n=1 Tax=Richelia sinica TaxID=1357545 RepID=UPI001689FA41|nr:DUF29 family protein [Richelia sinica]MBD2664880.1 DUF29 family protein [Richelia sinica FACHB-800]
MFRPKSNIFWAVFIAFFLTFNTSGLRTTINQIRAGQFSLIDLDNLLAELENMGRSQRLYFYLLLNF